MLPPRIRQTARLSAKHVFALLQRYFFLLSSSWPRVLEVVFWPIQSIVAWGFFSFYLDQLSNGVAVTVSMFLGAAILWEIFARGSLSVFVPFMEELWSRNLGQLFVSPLTPYEYVAGLISISFVRTVLAVLPCAFLAYLFFDYSLLNLGLPLIGFFFNLLMASWWCGLIVISMLLRFGAAIEWLAWILTFALQPFMCVFYPVSTLPAWLQPISWMLPPTYSFEGLRALIHLRVIRYDLFVEGFGINLIYMALGIAIFLRSFKKTRQGNGLLQVSE